jgi:Ca2+-binding RTX toxin-like protein
MKLFVKADLYHMPIVYRGAWSGIWGSGRTAELYHNSTPEHQWRPYLGVSGVAQNFTQYFTVTSEHFGGYDHQNIKYIDTGSEGTYFYLGGSRRDQRVPPESEFSISGEPTGWTTEHRRVTILMDLTDEIHVGEVEPENGLAVAVMGGPLVWTVLSANLFSEGFSEDVWLYDHQQEYSIFTGGAQPWNLEETLETYAVRYTYPDYIWLEIQPQIFTQSDDVVNLGEIVRTGLLPGGIQLRMKLDTMALDGNDRVWLPSISDSAGMFGRFWKQQDSVTRFWAGPGNDEVHGADDDDAVYGGEGNDVLYGEGGDDTLIGDSGTDHLFGGEGNDHLDGGAGGDFIFGGPGNDTLSGGRSIDPLTIIDDREVDILDGGPGRDFFYAGVGDRIVELEVGESVELLGTANLATHYYVYRSGDSVFLGAFSDSLIPFVVAEILTPFDLREIAVVTPPGGNAHFTRTGIVPPSQTFATADSISQAVNELKAQIDTFARQADIGQLGSLPDALKQDTAIEIAKELSKILVTDKILGKFVPGVGNILGAQALIQTFVLDFWYDYYADRPLLRTASYASAIAGALGPLTYIPFQVGSYFVVEYAKSFADFFGALAKGIRFIMPDPEGTVTPEDGPDYIVIPLGNTRASVNGTLNTLNGDTIFNFTPDHKIALQGTTFGREALSVTFGSAILNIDADRDGVVDAVVTLAGDFDGMEFSVRSVGGNTEISFAPAPALRIEGTSDNDRLEGGTGKDTILGGEGSDTLIGGGGGDQLFGGATEDDLRDVIYGGDGNDTAYGGAGNDEIRGDAGNDLLFGETGADTLIGGTGNDTLNGGSLGDVLFGGDGDDFLNGGFGFDRLNGGAGADTFFHLGVFDHGSDWIQDYSAADGDVLQIGIAGARRDQFQINIANTPNAGAADVAEAFVIYRPTGQIIWALVDGAGQESINLRIGAEVFDLLA